ncbi:MAG: hypothetical protein AB7K09_14445, partial [Planctomycetota bacterium]
MIAAGDWIANRGLEEGAVLDALVFLLPYLASAIVSSAIGLYSWTHRNAAARWFGAASFAQMLYTVGFIAEISATNPG